MLRWNTSTSGAAKSNTISLKRIAPAPSEPTRVAETAMRGAPPRKDVCIPVRDLCHPILNHAAHRRILHGKKVARRATHNRLPRRHEVLEQCHAVLYEVMGTQ
ncbi:hypothetical protein TcG_11159 [Trypanosoma cruzi]|nr:hypothetical protein TcG_11159 [Trypanosoma cruzi]